MIASDDRQDVVVTENSLAMTAALVLSTFRCGWAACPAVLNSMKTFNEVSAPSHAEAQGSRRASRVGALLYLVFLP